MAIVLPEAQYRNSDITMISEEVQADISDPEGLLGTVRSWQNDFLELQELGSKLTNDLQRRVDEVSASERLNDELEIKMAELGNVVHTMETLIHTNQESVLVADSELEELTNLKDRLDSEVEGVSGQEVTITSEDVSNEQRHAGYVRDEILKKMEELYTMKERLDNAKHDLEQEWSGWKEDIKSNREQKQDLHTDVDHVRELTLARFIGMQSQSDVDSSAMTDRVVQFHEAQIQQRNLQNQLTQSEIEASDIENEIGDLVAQKKSLWKRYLDLESCLDEMKDADEGSIMLRPATAHQDLHQLADGHRPPHTSVSEQEVATNLDFEHTGKILHRCHKHTNIAIGESLGDANQDAAIAQVDTGGLDAAPGPPDPDRDQGPDEDPEGGDESTHEQTINKLLDTLQQKGITQAHIDTILDATKTIEPEATEQPSSSLMFKMRKRVGAGFGAISSSSQKQKGGRKISATGSMRRLAAAFKRGGRR